MARNKEYIPVRYTPGTRDRLGPLKTYIATLIRGKRKAENVSDSDVMREALDLGLEILERRAEAWGVESGRH